MSQEDTSKFYLELPVQDTALSTLLTAPTAFSPIPADWQVIITDIRGSTQAVKSGLQQEVNLIATGSIIAALNIARDADTDIPFFFGGDGATLMVPPNLFESTFLALTEHRKNVHNNFALELRVGHVPVSDIYAAGHNIRITRAKKTAAFSMPVVLGNGLKYADQLIKGWDFSQYLQQKGTELNLSGMECRWDTIPPPQESLEVVCLLIDVDREEQQARVYQNILDRIEVIYGSQEKRQPVSVARLHLITDLRRLATEVRIKFGRSLWQQTLKSWLITLFGQFYLRFDSLGRKYLNEIVELADTLVIDGRIATVISGTADQRQKLIQALDLIEANGDIKYGLFVSPQSIMSCYVRNRHDDHIHFVDGANGGYTQASKVLKAKFLNKANQ